MNLKLSHGYENWSDDNYKDLNRELESPGYRHGQKPGPSGELTEHPLRPFVEKCWGGGEEIIYEYYGDHRKVNCNDHKIKNE